jgi:hypothetical protein
MLADAQDGIHSQFLAADAERFVNRRKERDFVRSGYLFCHVAFARDLISVEADDLAARIGLLAIEVVRLEEILEQDMGVTAIGEFGENRGDAERLVRGSRERASAGERSGCSYA